MKRYAVELTDTALTAITEQVTFIARSASSRDRARLWLQRLWNAVDSFEL